MQFSRVAILAAGDITHKQQSFIQEFYLGGRNIDTCKGCIHASVHLLGFCSFNEILYAVLCYCVVYPIVAVETIMTSNFWGRGGGGGGTLGNPSTPHPPPPPLYETLNSDCYHLTVAVVPCILRDSSLSLMHFLRLLRHLLT